MLEIKNASIKVGERKLFEGLSLTVEDGEAVALVGGDGCGKSLLLLAVMGLWPLSGGLVSIDGELLTPSSASEFRRHTAYVPQAPAPTGEKVETTVRRLYELEANKGRAYDKQRLATEMARLGLAPELLSKRDSELSSSERQRMVLATAGVLDKAIVLVDEPFAEEARAGQVAAYLARMAEKGASVFVASRRNMGETFTTVRI